MTQWLRPWTAEESERVSSTIWPLGIKMVIAGAGVQFGMMIGAETTTVTMLPEVLTPGWFGPAVAVGPAYRLWWEATEAVAIIGLLLLLFAFAIELGYDRVEWVSRLDEWMTRD